MKTQEELDQLKKECETMNNKLKQLSEDELKLIIGGIGADGYKYSFRRNDYVYMSGDKRYRFVVDEDIDTNDDTRSVNGHRTESSVKERDVSYLTKNASYIYSCYINNGGKLTEMN